MNTEVTGNGQNGIVDGYLSALSAHDDEKTGAIIRFLRNGTPKSQASYSTWVQGEANAPSTLPPNQKQLS